MKRLVKLTDDNVPYCVGESECLCDDCYDCQQFNDIRTKLAHYEDLEEAGRLMILP